ncbi:MAG: colanic acid biosynthesis acetyltransferase WcaF [Bacteroidia bacterium]|nr:colanic acid biosynthesis acetyltransferase WcaF [Bacteroidia bacterium]
MPEKVDLSKFNNDHYKVGAGMLKQICWYVVSIMFFKTGFPFYPPKCYLLKLFGAKVGKNLSIKPHVTIKYPWKLTIGNNVWIGEQVWIDNLEMVTFRDNVCVSQGSLILCGNHNYKSPTFDLLTGPVTLNEGCWIGARCIITAGVEMGSHSVLLSGSVASKNLEPYKIYRTHAAEFVKDRIIEQP